MGRWFCSALLALCFGSVGSAGAEVPAASGHARSISPAPNYADPGAWAAWPGRPSGAHAVPAAPGLHDQEREAKADVFFVHPTTFLTGGVANAPYDAPGIAATAIQRTVLRVDAGAFNACCRVFVPRYRQASLATFFRYGADSAAVLDLAYSDVQNAFDYYVAHENHGRPIILASHSQGSLHALRLLQERIVGSPLQERMVAAYIVGYAVSADIEHAGVTVCSSARQTRCLIHWASVERGHTGEPRRAWIWRDGRYQAVVSRTLVCVNPLNWQRDATAPASANLGALPRAWPGQELPSPIPALTGAACEGGLLGVSLPVWARPRFSDLLTLFGSYHDFDFHLFYMNIRQNAVERVVAFLKTASR
jgi:hypothetical protein